MPSVALRCAALHGRRRMDAGGRCTKAHAMLSARAQTTVLRRGKDGMCWLGIARKQSVSESRESTEPTGVGTDRNLRNFRNR